MATRLGELDTVKCLVDEGANINSDDMNGVRVTMVPMIYISTADLSTRLIIIMLTPLSISSLCAYLAPSTVCISHHRST